MNSTDNYRTMYQFFPAGIDAIHRSASGTPSAVVDPTLVATRSDDYAYQNGASYEANCTPDIDTAPYM